MTIHIYQQRSATSKSIDIFLWPAYWTLSMNEPPNLKPRWNYVTMRFMFIHMEIRVVITLRVYFSFLPCVFQCFWKEKQQIWCVFLGGVYFWVYFSFPPCVFFNNLDLEGGFSNLEERLVPNHIYIYVCMYRSLTGMQRCHQSTGMRLGWRMPLRCIAPTKITTER